MVAVRHGQQNPRGPGQRLRLTLAGPRSGQIARATVTVHGMTPKGRVIEADSSSIRPANSSAEATMTLDLVFTADGEDTVSSDLWAPGFSSVTSIELDSVTYANGSIWKFSNRDMCQVAPDPLMLIAAQ